MAGGKGDRLLLPGVLSGTSEGAFLDSPLIAA